MGGRVAIEMGLEAPDRVDRMVLLAPSPAFIRRREFVRLVRLLRPELALLPVPLWHRHVVRGIRFMFARPDRLPQDWYAAAADKFIRIFRTRRGRIAFFSAAREIYLEEPYGERGFWDRLPDMLRPALFVWGEKDLLTVPLRAPRPQGRPQGDLGRAPRLRPRPPVRAPRRDPPPHKGVPVVSEVKSKVREVIAATVLGVRRILEAEAAGPNR
jgi:pimeloyl-ACP methyl ester carboxylesterase